MNKDLELSFEDKTKLDIYLKNSWYLDKFFGINGTGINKEIILCKEQLTINCYVTNKNNVKLFYNKDFNMFFLTDLNSDFLPIKDLYSYWKVMK